MSDKYTISEIIERRKELKNNICICGHKGKEHDDPDLYSLLCPCLGNGLKGCKCKEFTKSH